jgi:cytochrome c biogenesis protein
MLIIGQSLRHSPASRLSRMKGYYLVDEKEAKSTDKTNPIWRFFSSVKLTFFLLIILAIASILGTIIPQRGQGAMEFARNISPEMFRFLSSLNLFDMYHSLWFRLIVLCLTLNLIICSINRFPTAWKRFRLLPRPDRDKPFENLPPQQEFSLQGGNTKQNANSIEEFLQRRYRQVNRKEDADTDFFYAEKGRYSHFGVYLVHLSVLIILIGGLVGSFFGFEGYVNIAEGEQTKTIMLRKRMSRMVLGFEVRCDKFTVDFYKNGAPKEYRSDISFIVNGKEVEKRSVLVNHPVQFGGITFYQANYGTVPGNKVRLKLLRRISRPEKTIIEIEKGGSRPLPGNEGRFRVIDLKGNFMNMGPAALIAIQPNKGEEIRFWLFKDQENIKERFPGLLDRFPKLNPSSFEPYTFFLEEFNTRYYTGLQVNRDPGVSIVWAGFFVIVAGFFVTFFVSHRRIWVRLRINNGETEVSIAGTSNKNPVGLQRELDRLTNDLKDLLKQRR